MLNITKKFKGVDLQDVNVEFNDTAIPREYYDIVDGDVVLNQQGFQFIKSASKKEYYEQKDSDLKK